MPAIFVSYSHLDRRWFAREDQSEHSLIPWLERVLARDGVSLWYDRSDAEGLRAGDEFRREIERRIDGADIALLLLSEAFFSSEFIRTVELPRIQARAERGEMAVIPILLEPCAWPSFDFVAERQMLPGRPTPLIDYTDSPRQWVHGRDEILSGIRTRLGKLRVSDGAPPPVEQRQAGRRPAWLLPAAIVAAAVVIAGGVALSGAFRREGKEVATGVTPTVPQAAAPTMGPAPTAAPSLFTGTPSAAMSEANETSTRPPVAAEAPASTPSPLASPLPSASAGQTWTPPIDGMTQVYVPAGEFPMGSAEGDPDAEDDEKPQHTVYLDAYWIDRTEVTRAQYQQCVEAGKCAAPNCSGTGQADHPVVCVSRQDAVNYCAWAGRRLPTEAEWEKAARGTDGRQFPWGNEVPDCGRANHGGCANGTVSAGSLPRGASTYGLLGMAGNAWEWVADLYSAQYYEHSDAWNPAGPADGQGVLRGGSYQYPRADIRAANRYGNSPDERFIDFGFRCARSAPEASTPESTATASEASSARPPATASTTAAGAGRTRTSPADGMVQVYVPAGEFLMGSADSDSDADSDEKPQHTVYLDAYWIDRTEVTEAQYQQCVDARICRAPDCSGTGKGDHPVDCVSWQDAADYCTWAGRRLPTEAEWEKAARGTDGRQYPWGNEAPDCNRLNYQGKDGGCVGATSAVGSYSSGTSPYGALDMAGNVWEWVADWYQDNYYAGSAARNPAGPASGQTRVLRGGSCFKGQIAVRAVNRWGTAPEDSFPDYGFRCARSP